MSIREKEQQRYWSNRALTYGHQYGLDRKTTRYKIKRKVQLMREYVDFESKNIIECGCGTGLFTKEFYKLNKNILVTDISNEMIEVARQLCPKAKFAQMDARQMNVPNNSYDIVLSTFLLQHVDTTKVLPEMYRILKKNGYLVALVPNLLNPWHYCRARVGIVRKIMKENSESIDFSRWSWNGVLKKYGFKPVCVKPIEFTSPYLPLSMLPLCTKVSEFMEWLPVVKEFAGTLLVVAEK